MDQIRAYILSVGAAGLLCAIIGRFAQSSCVSAKALKLVSGLFMLVTLLQPFGRFDFQDLTDYLGDFTDAADAAVSAGENRTALAVNNSIKESLATYILDKGADYGANLTVQVFLDEAFPPNLISISLSGDISPYGKQALMETLHRDLGLSNEEILWQ